MLEQSAVCLPELHLQVHREGQEERKSDVERFTKLTTNRSNMAAILEISFCDQWAKHLQGKLEEKFLSESKKS